MSENPNKLASKKFDTKEKRKFIILVNPIAGTSKKEKIIAYVKECLDKKEIPYKLFPTVKEGNYQHIFDKIVEESITDVIIVGGDGTVNNVVNALRNLHINFGIIPIGSGNGLARSAGISMKPKKALEQILTGKPQLIDAFTVNGEFACMLAGLGLDAQVAHDFAKSKSRGLITYIRKTIVDFIKARPYPFEIEVDGKKFFTEAYFISIANANQFGNNFKIAPMAKLNDGFLDIVIVQRMKKAKLPFAVFKHVMSKAKLKELTELSEKEILCFQARQLIIYNIKNAPIHIDGEPIQTKYRIEIKIKANSFKII